MACEQEFSQSIVGRIMKQIKVSRTKNKKNREFVTLEEFFFYALDFEEVKEDMSECGMSIEHHRIFQDMMERYISALNTTSTTKTKKQEEMLLPISENLNYILRSVSAKAMNLGRPISFKDVILSVLFQDETSDVDKCMNLRELLKSFNVCVESSVELAEIKACDDIEIIDDLKDHDETKLTEVIITNSLNKNTESSAITMTPQEKRRAKSNSAYVTEILKETELEHCEQIIGRDKYTESIANILNCCDKPAVLLVGHSGVGKSSIIKNFAKSVIEGKVNGFEDYGVYNINMSWFLDSTGSRSDMVNIMNTIINFAIKEKSILVMENIDLLQLSGSSYNDLKPSDLIIPMLKDSGVKLIATTTYEGKSKHMTKDQSVIKHFEQLDVEEVSVETCHEIISKNIEKYSNYHGVSYDQNAITKSVELANRYINNKKMPEKAFSVIDKAGALSKSKNQKTVTVEDVCNVISKATNIPIENISNNGIESLLDLDGKLSKSIFGQDEAIRAIADEILIAKSGIGENGKTKPLGSFMFAGPTGVGKTEVTNELAKVLSMNLIRLDMSEFMEKQNVSRIIGSPPGYVDSSETPIFLKKVIENPYSIVLFDEFEKAHPQVQNLLLQLLDNGKITSATGQEVDFRNTIIIFTTNAGSNVAQNGTIGMFSNSVELEQEAKKEKIQKELERLFKPEFRNRLDHIVYFNSMTSEMAQKITTKKLNNISKDLMTSRNLKINFDQILVDKIANSVFSNNNQMGARPIDREIKALVSKQLSIALLRNNFAANEQIMGTIEDDKIIFKKVM